MRIDPPARALAHGIAGARDGTLGAGDFVWSTNRAQLDVAIVLEPEVPASICAQVHYLSMVALGDALGARIPPEIAVTYRWPGTLCVNGARAGAARLAMSPERDENGWPRWLVAGVEIALRGDLSDPDPGRNPDITSLDQEGAGDVSRTELIESFARHFLSWLHRWEDEGFAPVHAVWLGRTEDRGKTLALAQRGKVVSGAFLGLDDHGNLLLKSDAGVSCVATLASEAFVACDEVRDG